MIGGLRRLLRQLARAPGFTAVAVITLGLGIGACTAIFSVVNSVLLRPLGYPEPEQLVVIGETNPPKFPKFSVASGHFIAWQRQSTSFESMSAIRSMSYNLTGLGEPMRLRAQRVTASFFGTLRAQPVLGRGFAADEDAPGKAGVAVLGHAFWVQHFGGRPQVLDKTIELDGQPFTIVGVMPKGLPGWDDRTDILTPIAFSEEDAQNHGGHNLDVIGRLKAGATLEQARVEMNLIAVRLAQQFPGPNKGWGVKLTPMLEFAVGGVRPALYALLGAVGFLLLIACANVANLLLARATARSREMGVRAALGASRGRIVRQLLGESLLLALLGSLLGVLIARLGLSALIASAPEVLPRAKEIAVDGRALGFTCALTLFAGVVSGLAPAMHAARVDINEILKEGGRGTSAGGHRQRMRDALVVTQVAIALVLLVGAGLLFRSFVRLEKVDPGFQSRQALAVGVSLPHKNYPGAPQQAAFVEQTVARLAAIPTVKVVGASQVVPFSSRGTFHPVEFADRPPATTVSDQPPTRYYAVTPDYFRAMGIRLLRGRGFEARDGANAPRVAIINQTMARKHSPDQEPLGRRISIGNGPQTWREIVGIVAEVKHSRRDDDAITEQTYEPFMQRPSDAMTFVVRTDGTASALNLAAEIRAEIGALDRDLPIASVRSLDEWLAQSAARERFVMILFAVFSGVALLLSAIGIYCVTAYAVTQRTGEIGIRMALGAQAGDVLGLVFRHSGQLVALGLVVGVCGALALTRLMASMLFGIGAQDPLTFGTIAALLAVVAVVACLLPARRATRVDPMTALRAE